MSLLPSTILPETEPLGTVSGNNVIVAHNWYLLFYNIAAKALGIVGANPPPAAQTVTPTGSPFTYTAPTTGTLSVTGGNGLILTLSRSTVSVSAGAGLIPMAGTDTLKISYTVAPLLIFFPFANTSA